MQVDPPPPAAWRVGLAVAIFLGTFLWPFVDSDWQSVWPSIVALSLVFLLRQTLLGLLVGGFSAALLLADGNPWAAFLGMMSDQVAPHFQSSWKMGALLFTLLLGGFAAMVEASGGFQALFRRLLGGPRQGRRMAQGAVAGLGVLCFFDGLANSLLVGRVTRSLAGTWGIARVKLAYLADSTSSSIACVAFLSTWIAFQLSMIEEGFAALDREVNPYQIFAHSVGLNFYCWLTLLLVGLTIWRDFNPGPMRRFEYEARRKAAETPPAAPFNGPSGGAWRALIPLAVLIVSLPLCFYLLGVAEADLALWPLTLEKIARAFGGPVGPLALVSASLFGLATAVICFPNKREGGLNAGWTAFSGGVTDMAGPLLILFAAWILSAGLAGLGAAGFIAGAVNEWLPLAWVPLIIFLVGALIAFTTGTSWGTMGLLMPLAIPLVGGHPGMAVAAHPDFYFYLVVAAVFSGAVFGDHCSPFSDTTIVSAIATGVTPFDHVRTQLPYALLTGAVAVLGFGLAGQGWPWWACWLPPAAVLTILAWCWPREPTTRDLGRIPK